MKNNILKFIINLYYLSLLVLLILYIFPGSIIGYFLYGDLGKQVPHLIINSVETFRGTFIGTSINHLIYFFYLTFLGLIFNLTEKKFINSFSFLFTLSIFLELFHFFIPNRAFELNDLLANSVGVVSVFLLFKIREKLI